MTIAMLLALATTPPEWLTQTLWPIFAGQAVIGVVGLIGLSVLFRRFVGTEFPAFVADVRSDLRDIDQDIRGIRADIGSGRAEMSEMKERIRNLERRQDNLDDTRSDRNDHNNRIRKQ